MGFWTSCLQLGHHLQVPGAVVMERAQLAEGGCWGHLAMDGIGHLCIGMRRSMPGRGAVTGIMSTEGPIPRPPSMCPDLGHSVLQSPLALQPTYHTDIPSTSSEHGPKRLERRMCDHGQVTLPVWASVSSEGMW